MKIESHDELVGRVVRKLEQRFYRNIATTRRNLDIRIPAADQMEDAAMVPDVTAAGQRNRRHLIAVEVENTLTEGKTPQSWMATAKQADECQGEFWIAVPKGLRGSVQVQLGELGIDAKIWEI